MLLLVVHERRQGEEGGRGGGARKQSALCGPRPWHAAWLGLQRTFQRKKRDVRAAHMLQQVADRWQAAALVFVPCRCIGVMRQVRACHEQDESA